MKQTHHFFVCKLQSDFLGFQINFHFLCSKLGISFPRKMPLVLLDEENIRLYVVSSARSNNKYIVSSV